MDQQKFSTGGQTGQTASDSGAAPTLKDETAHNAIGQETEATFPAVSEPGHAPNAAVPEANAQPRPKRRWIGKALLALVFILAVSGAYYAGFHGGRAASNSAGIVADKADTDLQVPDGATIISQCAVGRGTQYVLPSNIPHGPVFNVYNGKVIGIEYMIGKDDLAEKKSFFNLPLYGKQYDHIDVGLVSQGHAGYPVPHYHVDVYNISRDASKAITCKS